MNLLVFVKGGEVCSEYLEGLTAKDFALAALDLKTGAAGTEGR